MKTLRSCGLALCAVLFSFFISCSSNEDDEPEDYLSMFYGTWVCTSSTDTYELTGEMIKDYMIGEMIEVKEDGTYISSAAEFGNTGKWSISGNMITATTNYGQSLNATVKISSSTMILEGKANGFSFHYEFKKV